MAELVIRPIRAQDAAGVAHVHTMSWRQAYAGLLPAEYLAARVVSAESWLDRLRRPNPGASTLVAVEDGSVIGFVTVGPVPTGSDPATGQLFAIYLLAEHWGVGIGRRMHEAGMAILARQGFTRAVLWVLEGNLRTIAFYERQGWTDDGLRSTEPVGDLVLPLRRMSIELAGQSSGTER